jgi:hypothetical protein
MVTEFTALNTAVRLSKTQFPDEIVVVFRNAKGDFCYCVESEYTGDDENITQRYLNGHITVA